MKQNLIFPVFLLITLLLGACSDEETTSCGVNVQVVFSEGAATESFDGIKVVLTNKTGGTVYTSACSSAGVAAFVVEPGDYAASVHYQTTTGVVFNGRIESLSLLPNTDEAVRTVKLALTQAKTNALVIKEVYYDGCKGKAGEDYDFDQYITLYNNSDETIYLDGLCVAEVDFSHGIGSPWMELDPDMERIPAGYFTWQFPGNGQDYPLPSGAETTIATNAVNHTAGEYGHQNSVNLSAVDWGFYHPTLKNVIAPDVKPMTMLLKVGTSNNSGFSMWGPTVMVFALPVSDVPAYVADPANREMEPDFWGDPNEMFLMVPREWIIDCVECVSADADAGVKRVPAVLDNEPFIFSSGNYSGKSFVRKKSVATNGRSVYQDTNNSAEDMEISVPLLKQ
ncbi:DUF4876 domain-containing protein [Bacteroides sp.]|uniref:DUF4876 domain-containing protein n=1 Tax=Bacteroides sp. TaxID=29523 RepID=UPI00262AC1F2|nr:DUF4876 domain-containing protein [Bacteroides sp.]MDD3038691.1 DUF4876 domain-containing protein [Bacteroides sp.]